MENTATQPVREKRMLKEKEKDLIFYVLMMAWPVVQFCIFYIGVNFNSFLMAFQRLTMEGEIAEWTGDVMIEALSKILGWDGGKNFTMAAERSFQVYAIGLFIGTPLGLLFSYYIYKKLPFSGLFRVLLFMPSIISGIVMVAMFKFFVQDAVPIISEELFGVKMRIGWLSGRSPADTKFATIMFFNTWAGFGSGVLMYSNAMSGTSQEVVESAHLDGAVGIREFIHITIPAIYPTLSTFLITGVAGIFTNQGGLFSFYGTGADVAIRTYGYEMYVRTLNAGDNMTQYSLLSAMGMWMTLVAVPTTLIVRWALEKFGPSED